MRCSACEPLLARYWDRTLPARQAARVAAHLQRCPHCSRLLDEIKVVDALLVTTAAPELPPNFTDAVMYATRDARPARRNRLPWIAVGAYLVLAWMLLFVWFALRLHAGTWARIALALPVAISIVVAVLCVDVLLAVGAVALYRRYRSRAFGTPGTP